MTDTPKPKAAKSKAAPIDLATLDTTTASDKGARIPMVHPISKEPIGVFVTVLGKHSETFRELVRERANEGIKKSSERARRGKQMPVRTAEELEREALELLIACTMGWDSGEGENYILFQGTQYEFNAKNGMLLYSKLIWLRDQVDDAIGDLENFIPA